MVSLGETLRRAREEKGLAVESAARDTNIARRYLTALETEDFAQFPAEAYALGFLKNYSEYLGLDVNEILSLFKVIKIQEQPLPMNELLTKTSGPPKVLPFIIILVVVLVGAGTGAFFLWKGSRTETNHEVAVHVPADYVLESGILEQRFYAGDSLAVPVNGQLYQFTLANLGEVVTINTPAGSLILDLSQTVSVDINNDGVDELEISLEDYARSEPLMGAWIRFDLQGGMSNAVVAEVETAPAVGNAAASTESNPPAVAPSQLAGARTVFTSNAPYPFTLQVQFQGYCMFRWEILREADRQGRTEQYFSRGGELNIQAQNGVRLWVSNAAFVRLQAIGGGRSQAVEIGGPGEIVVADIAWIRDEASGWRLALLRLEN
jgi:cytoskeletal protein RodZ